MSYICLPGAVGLSLIHAMAYGLPCLVHSNRLQHMPEIADQNRYNRLTLTLMILMI